MKVGGLIGNWGETYLIRIMQHIINLFAKALTYQTALKVCQIRNKDSIPISH